MPSARILPTNALKGRWRPNASLIPSSSGLQVPVAPLKSGPDGRSGLDTQAMLGEVVKVFEEGANGWSWVQLDGDGYVGYIPSNALGPFGGSLNDEFIAGAPTHKVSAVRTFVYPGPDLKYPAAVFLSMGTGGSSLAKSRRCAARTIASC